MAATSPHERTRPRAVRHLERHRGGGVRRQDRLDRRSPVLRRPPGPPGRLLRHRHLAGLGAVRRALRHPDVLHHRRLPPVLLPSELQDGAGGPVRHGLRGHHRRTEGTAVVGQPPPCPPPLHRSRRGRALSPGRLLVEPRRLDPVHRVQGDRPERHQRLRLLSRVAPPRAVQLGRTVDAGHRLLRDRGVGRPADRLLPVDGAAVARHLPGQLGGPPVRPAAVRHPRHQPQLTAHRRHHRGGGMAQQPPLPAGVVTSGVRLVGGRPHLVRPAGSGRPPAGPRSQGSAGPTARSGPGGRRGLRHRDVPFVLGTGDQDDRPEDRRPQCPPAAAVERGDDHRRGVPRGRGGRADGHRAGQSNCRG